MASSMMRFLSLVRPNSLLETVGRGNLYVISRKYSSSQSKDNEFPSTADQVVDTTSAVDDDDDLMGLRDISRMPKQYRNRLSHVLNPPEQPDYITDMNRSIELKRKLYAKYGRRSGLDPGLLWPSDDELTEQIEFEKDWEPTLQQLMTRADEQRCAETKEIQEKRQLVARQMAKMPKLVDEYRAKLAKEDQQELQRDAKRRALLDEARDYFGYDVDPRDPRFQRMQEMKEEEERKLKKQKKKESKGTRWLDEMKKQPQQSNQ